MALGVLHRSRHMLKRLPHGTYSVDDRLVYGFEDTAFIFELHLALLRMDVDINRALRHGDIQNDQGETRFRQK